MKKVFTVLVIMLFMFSLVACGNDTDEAKTPVPHAEGETETQPVAVATPAAVEGEDEAQTATYLSSAELEEEQAETQTVEQPEVKEESDMLNSEVVDTIRLFIGEEELPVKWEENESVDALRELVGEQPLSIQMSMYGGFEQVGALGTALPRNDVQTTTRAGDIVLYSGNQIVIFYGSNSWAYTRLGKVTDMSAGEMAKLLGNGDVVITLSE